MSLLLPYVVAVIIAVVARLPSLAAREDTEPAAPEPEIPQRTPVGVSNQSTFSIRFYKMPGFPHPGSLTICEINRELIIAEKLSDEQAKETYGKFTSGRNQVTIRDYEDSEGKDPCVLTSEFQRDVKVLEWRPNSGKTLAVGCTGEICIWSASYPSNAAMVRPGIASSAGGVSRASGVRWTLVDFLRSPDGEQISALCWNPDGRFLASASSGSSSFTIWDVVQGLGTPIRRRLGAISMLKWSPTGDYFFTAKSDGTFYIWETNTWTSEPWSSTSGNITGAAWDPDGRMILLAFSQSTTLGSIHFASKSPSLDAHLLPVESPEIALTGSHGIKKIAWDASGERLALSFQGSDDMFMIFEEHQKSVVLRLFLACLGRLSHTHLMLLGGRCKSRTISSLINLVLLKSREQFKGSTLSFEIKDGNNCLLVLALIMSRSFH